MCENIICIVIIILTLKLKLCLFKIMISILDNLFCDRHWF